MKQTIWMKNGRFTVFAVAMMFLVPLLAAGISICAGRMPVTPAEVAEALKGALTGNVTDTRNYSIIVNLRLPRILMAVIVGAGLTCAGASFQALFSNPLATPDILGVMSGTCVGAIAAIIMSAGLVEIQLAAFAAGLVACYLTIKVAGDSINRSVVFLVLAGTIMSSLYNAIGSILKYTADPQSKLPEITYWLMGSFTSASYKKILIGLPFILTGIVVIFLLRWRLNLLSLSEDEAKTSGIDIRKTRLVFILASTAITASSVAMCGQVGWIGLLIPHCARLLTGSNNRYVIPVCISLGAAFMILIDTLARTVSVLELPISVLTAVIGAPVFISLLKRSRDTLH